MRKEDLFHAIGDVDEMKVTQAGMAMQTKKRSIGRKWGALVACLCLVLCGVVWMQHNRAPLPVAEAPTCTEPSRAVDFINTRGPQSTPETIDGESIPVFENAPIGINADKIEEMRASLVAAGWLDIKCTLLDEYSFVLKGTEPGGARNLSDAECAQAVKAFLRDSRLEDTLKEAEIEYEIVSSASDGIAAGFCYLLCNGSRTGAYIRFVFEDDNCIGEVQAYLYSSTCMDTLALLPLDEALNHAYKVDADGSLSEINPADYTISNTELVYRNGLPYYTFNGYGIHTRGFIDGYALAVDIETSSVSEKLMETHRKNLSSIH